MARARRLRNSTYGPICGFFACHFEGDPVMPGCLGLDALWQLLGFYLGWTGAPGRGRALSVGEVKFTGQVLRRHSRCANHLDIKRVINRQLVLGIADGTMAVDGKVIYEAKDLRVGLFTSDRPVLTGIPGAPASTSRGSPALLAAGPS